MLHNINTTSLPKLSTRETERAIKLIKDTFERELTQRLNLQRVTAPLFVPRDSGLNDNLNGVERPVNFDAPALAHETLEVVQSLAKWKRLALHRHGFAQGEGLYTDMNAIRRDEELSCIHSLYVDQWDWEKVICPEDRTMAYLHSTVGSIYESLKGTEQAVHHHFPHLLPGLPEDITFITSQELEDQYPYLSPKEREDAIAQKFGAVFISQIGSPLASGRPHDGRAPDYDDWSLNGDIIVWHKSLKMGLELSSMGIRVDRVAMKKQLEALGCSDRQRFEFHQMVLQETLPLSIGGGIGQSRMCMYFLQKSHIGEVQASSWPRDLVQQCQAAGIVLL